MGLGLKLARHYKDLIVKFLFDKKIVLEKPAQSKAENQEKEKKWDGKIIKYHNFLKAKKLFDEFQIFYFHVNLPTSAKEKQKLMEDLSNATLEFKTTKSKIKLNENANDLDGKFKAARKNTKKNPGLMLALNIHREFMQQNWSKADLSHFETEYKRLMALKDKEVNPKLLDKIKDQVKTRE